MEPIDRSDFFTSLVWHGKGPPPSEHSGSEPVLKRCTKCQTEQQQDEFWKSGGTKDGLHVWCKSCFRANRKRPRECDPCDEPCEVAQEPNDGDSLYIMTNSLIPNIVKIGRSFNPEERARQLGMSHPFRLIVENSYGGKGFLERVLHDRLKHRRVEGGLGREWFKLKAEQADVLIRASIVDHEIQ